MDTNSASPKDPPRVYSGGGGEALAFQVFGVIALVLTAVFLVYLVLTPQPAETVYGTKSSGFGFCLLVAMVPVGGGLWLIILGRSRSALRVTVSADAVVVRTRGRQERRVAIADVLNFYPVPLRDSFGLATPDFEHALVTQLDTMVIPYGTESDASIGADIADELCAIHWRRMRQAVREDGYPVADTIVLTTTGAWDINDRSDGLRWEELEADTGGGMDAELRMWRRGGADLILANTARRGGRPVPGGATAG